jgi:hypothetical protein
MSLLPRTTLHSDSEQQECCKSVPFLLVRVYGTIQARKKYPRYTHYKQYMKILQTADNFSHSFSTIPRISYINSCETVLLIASLFV